MRDGSKSNSQNSTKINIACPHTAAHTVETLKKLNFEVQQLLKPTNTLLSIVFILKLVLKHLKSSKD
jgi:hypothetical protein